MNKLKIFSGNANLNLARGICKHIGVDLGKANVSTYSDGEICVEIEENVRGFDVFVIQPTCQPDRNLMELLVLIDACKRSSAERIVAVMPYYGYARQDRKVAPRAPITAKMVADLLTAVGAHRIIAMDLHAGQIQGFFNIPVDNLFAQPIFLEYIKNNYQNDLVVVSPDAGGVERARSYAKKLDAGLAIIDKRRNKPGKSEVMNVVGEVAGKNVIILDDIIDTAGTITQAAQSLKEKGAKKVLAACVHPVLSGKALKRIESSCIEELLVANTISLGNKNCDKIKVLSVDRLLAEAIKRIHRNESISVLFV